MATSVHLWYGLCRVVFVVGRKCFSLLLFFIAAEGRALSYQLDLTLCELSLDLPSSISFSRLFFVCISFSLEIYE
jgi:hypothetical protein